MKMGITLEKVKDIFNYSPTTGLFRYRHRSGPRAPKGAIAGNRHYKGYWRLTINGRQYAARRIAWLYYYGKLPERQIDHKNRIRDDNRICNLRQATNSQNKKNSKVRSDNVCNVKGISRKIKNGKVLFVARIQVRNKRHYLGGFFTIEAAASAYWTAAQKYYGKFARAA